MRSSPQVDGETIREVMRKVPFPVTVVTVHDGTRPQGITIGSFTSTSLFPPLISFNIDKSSQVYKPLTTAGFFAVHILREDQAHLSQRFALAGLSGEAQFENVAYSPDETGVPLIKDTMVLLLCSRYAVYDAGDHSLVVGKVIRVDYGAGEAALLYHNLSYRKVGAEVGLQGEM